MALVVDIRCPDCGRARPVRKSGLGTYRCSNCGREFTQDDVAA